jgi:hypothetical protein
MPPRRAGSSTDRQNWTSSDTTDRLREAESAFDCRYCPSYWWDYPHCSPWQAVRMCYPLATKERQWGARATQHKFAETVSCLRYNDRVAGLKFNILSCILPLDDFLVIERQSCLAAVGILTEDINRFLFGKVAEPAGESDRIEHRC